MRLPFSVLLAAAVALGCGDSDKNDDEGLPPAQSWEAPNATGAPVPGQGGSPHAGMGGGGDPHAGMNMNDPHAGVDMGGGGPHAGGMGAGASDPEQALSGIITASDAVSGKVSPGDTLFLYVRAADEQGQPSGDPTAVAMHKVSSLPMSFELGAGKSGKVVVGARVDKDADASTKTAGDVEGTIAVEAPNDSVVLELDTVRE